MHLMYCCNTFLFLGLDMGKKQISLLALFLLASTFCCVGSQAKRRRMELVVDSCSIEQIVTAGGCRAINVFRTDTIGRSDVIGNRLVSRVCESSIGRSCDGERYYLNFFLSGRGFVLEGLRANGDEFCWKPVVRLREENVLNFLDQAVIALLYYKNILYLNDPSSFLKKRSQIFSCFLDHVVHSVDIASQSKFVTPDKNIAHVLCAEKKRLSQLPNRQTRALALVMEKNSIQGRLDLMPEIYSWLQGSTDSVSHIPYPPCWFTVQIPLVSVCASAASLCNVGSR